MKAITINGRPMRLTFGSNSPLVPGGYGMTTSLVVPRLRDRLGIEVAISATYGHYGRKIVWQGIDIYPPGNAMFGNDIHAANAKQHRADILLTHQDVWTQFPDQITAGGTRWVSWQPLDSEPVAPTILERLRDYCYQPIALSRFGRDQADLAGLPMPMVLQGIDTNAFVPGDRSEARRALGWPQDTFIIGMVARNSGYPNRKAYPQQLKAWIAFAKRHKDAMLYIHAAGNEKVDPEATPIDWQLRQAGLIDRVIWASPYDLNIGYSTERMVQRYQAFDALSEVSMSEGCGLPLLEAQSCGIPVVTGAWTAMEENCFAGWMVAKEDSEPWPVSPLECEWRLPHVGAITDAYEAAYGMLQNDETRAQMAEDARAGAGRHDQDLLIDTQWRPLLEALARRIEAERVPWHVHRWTGWGHKTPAGVVQACMVTDCPAEHCGEETATEGFPLEIDGIMLDIQDDPNGGVRRAIAEEIVRSYRLPELEFEKGEVVLDVGAHVGVVSCYLAKKWPEARIYAFEPWPANYERLVRNIAVNGITNVTPFNRAVSCDGRDLEIAGDCDENTGGYSAFTGGPDAWTVPSVALLDWLMEHQIGHIALLKLDCEGAEYEILSSLGERLRGVSRLVMEVHENSLTRGAYGSGARLIADMERRVPFVRASLIPIPDPETIHTQEDIHASTHEWAER